mgnify:CR=1
MWPKNFVYVYGNQVQQFDLPSYLSPIQIHVSIQIAN